MLHIEPPSCLCQALYQSAPCIPMDLLLIPSFLEAVKTPRLTKKQPIEQMTRWSSFSSFLLGSYSKLAMVVTSKNQCGQQLPRILHQNSWLWKGVWRMLTHVSVGSSWWTLSPSNQFSFITNYQTRWRINTWTLLLWRMHLDLLIVFNHEPHSGSGGSGFPMPFWTRKDQRHFSNDRNRFQKVLAPFQTRNRRKHFNCLTISYVCLNLSLPFVTAPITIHYKLHSGPSGGSIQVYLRPWYIYIYPTYKHLSRLHPSKTAAEVSFSFHLVSTSI